MALCLAFALIFVPSRLTCPNFNNPVSFAMHEQPFQFLQKPPPKVRIVS